MTVLSQISHHIGDSGAAVVWLALLVCLALVGWAGPRLSWSGDVIAKRTGLSSSWVGILLIATVTSLPELVTGVSAVTIAAAPEIAVGDVLGSCVFNLAILIVLEFLQRGESVYSRVQQGHILSAGFGVIIIGFAGASVLLSGSGLSLALGHVGSYTPIILVLYALGMRAVFSYERTHRNGTTAQGPGFPRGTLRRAAMSYAAAAAVIVAVGTALPFVAGRLADVMEWHRSFVGTIVVATVTSLPELVVSVSALRIGAADMAVANLLGSNLFNMMVLGLDDILYRKGPLLFHVSPVHAVSALSAVIMSGIVIVGLVYRPQRRFFRAVGWTGLGLFTVYLLNSYVLYLHGI